MTQWHTVADLDELPPGERVVYTVKLDDEHHPVIVFNIDDQLYAVSNLCPHAGLPLDAGDLAGCVLTCPYHGYAYNVRNGANIDMPDFEPPVRTYPVRVEGQAIQVDVTSPPEQP